MVNEHTDLALARVRTIEHRLLTCSSASGAFDPAALSNLVLAWPSYHNEKGLIRPLKWTVFCVELIVPPLAAVKLVVYSVCLMSA